MKCLCPAADGRNILKANAVRLAPWDRTQDHSRFLQLCRDEGLHLGAANGSRLAMARNGGELLGRLQFLMLAGMSFLPSIWEPSSVKMLEGSLVLSATAGTGNAIPAGILDDALRHRVAGTQYHPVASREWSAGLHHSNKFHSHIRPYCLYLSLRPCGWFAGCVFLLFCEDVHLRRTTEGCVGTVSEVHTEGHAEIMFHSFTQNTETQDCCVAPSCPLASPSGC